VIRFPCANCGRKYVLPDALAGLPHICKGCGQRLTVPAAGEGDEPEPIDEEVNGEAVAAEPKEPPIFLSDDLKGEVDLKPEYAGEPSPQIPGRKPPPAPAPPPPVVVSLGQRALGLAADVVAGLVLAALGILLGEFATGKSTADILRDAGSAPKFPPTDLLLWLGCVATPVMGYLLFARRGKSLGGWLRRRAGG
jgi:hypothetical protein